METTHRVLTQDARGLDLPPETVHLVVTSPPYPMIAMWDEVFAALDPKCGPLLEADPAACFEACHATLDTVWEACWRALVPGGLLCVNIGDATRTVGGTFRLWSNHARVIAGCQRIGFSTLPDILWRKPTNAPNKFMGSGMLPGGAYVTYEHEYILVFRKGGGRAFDTPAAKQLRRESAYFWEERNRWFSDLWEGLIGADQALAPARPAAKKAPKPTVQAGLFVRPSADEEEEPTAAPPPRERSAAFPLDLPWRLIHMYSVYGDVVLDPFAGTGTTALAAACAGRSSLSVEREPALAAAILDRVRLAPRLARAAGRRDAHRAFVAERTAAGKAPGHHNAGLDLPVVTGQETELVLWEAEEVEVSPERARVAYRRT
jgi:DNA modification methylase